MMTLEDAFGHELKVHDSVAFAGTDYRRKPTINLGMIEEISLAKKKVKVRREGRSGRHSADNKERIVWVEVTKVCRVG
jgi:hypothetical protein